MKRKHDLWNLFDIFEANPSHWKLVVLKTVGKTGSERYIDRTVHTQICVKFEWLHCGKIRRKMI